MNVLSVAAIRELTAVLASLAPETRLVTFRSGRENVFASGADMREMRRFDAAGAEAFSAEGQQLMRTVERLHCATVALIDGDCFGGALDLALSFDLRFASPRARFSHPGARIGIVTGFGGTSRWRGTMAARSARALFLGNGILTADTALAMGVVDAAELPPLPELIDRAENFDRATLEAVRRPAAMSLGTRMLLAERLDDLYSAAAR